MSGFDLDLYLDRLGIDPVPVTAQGLARLQSAQIRRIPFEDIDPFLGIAPGVGSEQVTDKILHRGRGGYCFEQNRLFQGALQALGFDVTRRVWRADTAGAPASAHGYSAGGHKRQLHPA